MKNTFLLLAFAPFLLFSCKNTTETTPPKTELAPPPVVQTPPTPVPPTSVTTCYELKFKKDITAVEMTITGDVVTGFYAWEPWQKDGGRGAFKGKKAGDIVTAVFTFMIEGSTQSEEILFKIEADKILKGSGAMDEKKGVLTIIDKTKIKWDETLLAVDCAKVKEPIKNAKEVADLIAKSGKK
jgi:hypothetical protein